MKIDKVLLQIVIEPTNSAWEVPILFAPKKKGSLLFNMLHKKRKAMTVKYAQM